MYTAVVERREIFSSVPFWCRCCNEFQFQKLPRPSSAIILGQRRTLCPPRTHEHPSVIRASALIYLRSTWSTEAIGSRQIRRFAMPHVKLVPQLLHRGKATKGGAAGAYEKWMYEDKEDVMDVELPVRKLCAMGTGEQVHILSYAAQDGKVDEFEHRVQALAFEMLDAQRGVTDVRVCHPKCGEVTFIVTLVSRAEGEAFQGPALRNPRGSSCGRRAGIRARLFDAARARWTRCSPFCSRRSPAGTTLHDTAAVCAELGRWFRPRVQPLRAWDADDPSKDARNVIPRRRKWRCC